MRCIGFMLACLSVGILALVTAPSAGKAESDLDEYRGQARMLVKQFAGTLRKTLQEAIAEGDLSHAIRICKTVAPEVARSFTQRGDWLVRRTALRVRNPENAPTREEKAVLIDFQARAEQGEKFAGMEYTGITERLDKPFFHYMRAIPLGDVCAQCHGKNIDPDLALLIQGLYPEDRATGFEVGDLRGAFTLYKPLP